MRRSDGSGIEEITPLTILSVAYPLAPVGPDAVGGAEQVLTLLDRELARAGHFSIVLACEGSKTAGALISMPRIGASPGEAARQRALARYRLMIEWILEEYRVDLIHTHCLYFYEHLPPPGVPVLATLHLPPAWYPPEAFEISRPRTYLHCVSASQRRDCPPCANLLPEIENGVPVGAFESRHARRRFSIALGRICPEKGFHVALDAAKRARFPMLLAGQVFPYEAHETYFREEIVPRLDASRRFIGPVGFARKRRLLSAARCLLAPSLAPETSSLVAMEALACGTPVVAFPSGALAEIVEHGRTGFLVNDEREMAEAVEAAGRLDPEQCRESARKRFSVERMAGEYFELYEKLSRAEGAAPVMRREEAMREGAYAA